MKKSPAALFSATAAFVFVLAAIILMMVSPARAQQSADDLEDPAQIFMYATGLMKRGFYDLALPQLETFRQKFPDGAHIQEVEILRINCLRELKSDSQALVAIQEYRNRWNDEKHALQLRVIEAECLYCTGNFEAAETCYRSLTEDVKGEAADKIVYYLAQSLLRQKKNAEAFKELEKLAALPLNSSKPFRAYASYAVSQEYLRKGKTQEAVALSSQLVDNQQLPENLRTDLTIQLGHIYFDQRDFEKSAYWYERFFSAYPTHPLAKVALRQLIFCKYNKEDYTAAFELAQKWHQIFPAEQDMELDYYQGRSAMKKGKYEAALVIWQAMAANDNASAKLRQEATLQTLDCLRLLNRHQDFLELAANYLETTPGASNRGWLLLEMGSTHLKLNNPAAALDCLKPALESFAGEPENATVTGRLLIQCHSQLQNWAEAAELCRRLATQARNQDAEAFLMQAADFSLQIPDEDAAIRDLNRAVDVSQNKENALWSLRQLAAIYLNRKDYDSVLPVIDRLVPMLADPLASAKWLFSKAQILAEKENYQEARDITEQLCTLQDCPPVDLHKYLDLNVQLIIRLDAADDFPDAANRLLQSAESLDGAQMNLEHLLAAASYCEQKRMGPLERKLLETILAKTRVLPMRERALEMLAVRLIADGAAETAFNHLAQFKDTAEKLPYPLSPAILSLMAEASAMAKNYKAAIVYADQALAANVPDRPITPLEQTRAFYVQALVLTTSNADFSHALPFAIKCFVLNSDPNYSPKAMAIAIECLEKTGNQERADQIRSELKATYPAAAAELLKQ